MHIHITQLVVVVVKRENNSKFQRKFVFGGGRIIKCFNLFFSRVKFYSNLFFERILQLKTCISIIKLKSCQIYKVSLFC